MIINGLEIIADDLRSFKSPKGEDFSGFPDKIPQKYSGLYEDVYKNKIILANFEKGDNLVVLNQEAKKVFDLVDGKRTVKDIGNFSRSFFERLKNYWPKNKKQELEKFSLFFNVLKKNKIISFAGDNEEKFPEGIRQRKLLIWLHLTNQCNFRCSYCYVKKTPQALSLKLGEEIIDKIFETAQKNNFNQVEIKFSGGEPLLEFKNLEKLVDFAEKKALAYSLSLNFLIATNGVLINEEVLKFLKKHNFSVMISLDGLPSFHDRQRKIVSGNESFGLVERAIKLLKIYGINFNINAIITKLNLYNLPDFTDWLIGQKIKFLFTFVRKDFSSENQDLIPDSGELGEVLSGILKNLQGKDFDHNFFSGISSSLANKVPSFSGDKKICALGANTLAIDEKGFVSPCQFVISHKQFKPISILDENFDITKFFIGQNLGKINSAVEERSECGECQWRYICKGGNCPLDSFFRYQRFGTASYYCPTFKAIIPEALKLKAEMLIRKYSDN